MTMRGLYDKYGLDEGTRTFTGRPGRREGGREGGEDLGRTAVVLIARRQEGVDYS